MHWLSAGEFHNSVPAQLTPVSQLGCLPLFYNYTRVNNVLPLKIVSVETRVPGEKPPQGVIGYLAYLCPRSEPIYELC